MKNIFRILLLAAIFTSCEDVEPTIYNGEEGNPSFLSFSQTAYSLPVERDGVGSAQIVLNSSTVSSVDRVYELRVIPSTSQFAADSESYDLPQTITIPAGQYQGFATIAGTDTENVDGEARQFTFEIVNVGEANIDTNVTTVNVFEVCTLGAPFTGTYNVQQITPNFGPAGTNAIGTGLITLVEGNTAFDRQFTAVPYAGGNFGLAPFNFIITFLCDGTSFTSGNVNTGIGCDSSIIFGAGASLGTYNSEDDSVFEVVITENTGSDCGTGPIQTRLRFTKVN